MADQRSFAGIARTTEEKQTRRERFLSEMDAVIPRKRSISRIEPFHPKPGRGRPPLDALDRLPPARVRSLRPGRSRGRHPARPFPAPARNARWPHASRPHAARVSRRAGPGDPSAARPTAPLRRSPLAERRPARTGHRPGHGFSAGYPAGNRRANASPPHDCIDASLPHGYPLRRYGTTLKRALEFLSVPSRPGSRSPSGPTFGFEILG
jgi:hypothetical protein